MFFPGFDLPHALREGHEQRLGELGHFPLEAREIRPIDHEEADWRVADGGSRAWTSVQ